MFAGCGYNGSGPEPNAMIMAEMAAERKKAAMEPIQPEQNYIILAKELMAEQHYDVALVQLKAAEKNNGCDPEVYYLMGVCRREIQEPEKAIKNFLKAIEMDPDFSFAHNGLGVTYALIGQFEKAREMFLKAIALNPARADFHNNMGFVEMKSGNYQIAESCFRKCLSKDPGCRRAVNNIAICLGLSGKDKVAMDLLLRHYSRAVALRHMGLVYQMKGENEKAAVMFNKVAEARIHKPKLSGPETDTKATADSTQTKKQKESDRPSSIAGAKTEVDVKGWTRVDMNNWAIVDEGDVEGPSSWYISDEILRQRSKIHNGSGRGRAPDKPGTYAVAGERLWADYCLDVVLRSSEDGAFGIILRCQDPENYYRFSMDSFETCRRLIRKSNGRVEVLAEKNGGYEKNHSYSLRAIAFEDRLIIYMDGRLIFDVRDSSILRGRVGVYSCGNAGSEFMYPVLRLYPG